MSDQVILGQNVSKWFRLALNFTYWANRVKVDQNWSNWIKNGQIWFDLVKLDQKNQSWSILDFLGQYGYYRVKRLSQVGQSMSEWVKLNQNSQKLSNFCRIE